MRGCGGSGDACRGARKHASGCRAADVQGVLMHQGRGGMGSHKHGVSGRPEPRPGLKRVLAGFFNEEAKRRTKRRSKMYSSLREALRQFKPKPVYASCSAELALVQNENN